MQDMRPPRKFALTFCDHEARQEDVGESSDYDREPN